MSYKTLICICLLRYHLQPLSFQTQACLHTPAFYLHRQLCSMMWISKMNHFQGPPLPRLSWTLKKSNFLPRQLSFQPLPTASIHVSLPSLPFSFWVVLPFIIVNGERLCFSWEPLGLWKHTLYSCRVPKLRKQRSDSSTTAAADYGFCWIRGSAIAK